ncbi:Heterokaryon incompatibility protein (HET) domain containing protein [Elaphomyces granulatus]|jgi:hypothetical protein
MRLLNAETIRLEEFTDTVPKYSILSHTWGKDEVSFKEIHRLRAKLMAGYRKIKECCKQTLQDGLKYTWIDTCCINKSSSAELSEAINSMFAWYKGSEICYAYLGDVVRGFKQVDGSVFLTYTPDRSPSRWYTRGWTLQELLAPSKVIFYNRSWKEIGTKQSLHVEISAITGIDRLNIIHFGWKPASIAQKMSWAAKRQTTREEDMAYSLLGLFDIQMPLLYGEGRNSFRRLQEELIKTSMDRSIFAWVLPRHDLKDHSTAGARMLQNMLQDRPWGILADSPACFAECGSISSNSVAENRSREAYAITNAGLRITIPIIKIEPNRPLSWIRVWPQEPETLLSEHGSSGRVIALLDCFTGPSEQNAAIAIILDRNKQRDPCFRRFHNRTLLHVDLTAAPRPQQEEIIVSIERIPATLPITYHGCRAQVFIHHEILIQGYQLFSGNHSRIQNTSPGFQMCLSGAATAAFDLKIRGQRCVMFFNGDSHSLSSPRGDRWICLGERTICCTIIGLPLDTSIEDARMRLSHFSRAADRTPGRDRIQFPLGNGLAVFISWFDVVHIEVERTLIYIECGPQ